MNLLAVVPWYYRALAVALLVAAVWGHGWVKGAAHVEAKFDAFRDQVSAAGGVQKAKHEAVTKQGAAITASVGGEYAKAVNGVSDLYGHGRVRSSARSSSAPTVSEAPGRADETTADPRPGASVVTSGETECKALKSDAAVTTTQLLYLQDWVEQQAAAWASIHPGTSLENPASGPR